MHPHSLTIVEACRRYGFGKTTLYALISRGTVEAVKLGTRTLVLADSIERHLASLPRLGNEVADSHFREPRRVHAGSGEREA
jgi:excisionase family DNA binding protein